MTNNPNNENRFLAKIRPLLMRGAADKTDKPKAGKTDDGKYMMVKKRHIVVTILLAIWTIIRTVFVMYAVLFTLASTFLIYKGYQYFNVQVMRPLNEVKALIDENPVESAYMTQTRELLRQQGQPDTLIHRFVPLDSISKQLVAAILAAEDDGFYTHPGFSLDAIVEAIDHNRTTGANKRGASTITQQLAKNLFLTPEKTFERKFKELGYTLLMEKYLGKDRILELYINYAQWGKNIFGCEAAANAYYNKNCINLTTAEAVRMASCLAMPTKITPLHTRSIYMGKRVVVIANNMYLRRRLDAAGYIALTGMSPPGYEEIPEEDIGEPAAPASTSAPVNDAGKNMDKSKNKTLF